MTGGIVGEGRKRKLRRTTAPTFGSAGGLYCLSVEDLVSRGSGSLPLTCFPLRSGYTLSSNMPFVKCASITGLRRRGGVDEYMLGMSSLGRSSLVG